MTYITVKEASEKWGISTRRICILCTEGRIPGAVKKSKVWMIPEGISKPLDGRKYSVKRDIEPIFIFNNPDFFGDDHTGMYEDEIYTICEIQNLYLRGKYEEALNRIKAFIVLSSSDRYLCVAYYIYMKLATNMGLSEEVDYAYRHLQECLNDSKKYPVESLMKSFYHGSIELLASFGAVVDAFEVASPLIMLITLKRDINKLLESGLSQDISAYELLCKELENKDCPEITLYCHLYLAVYYNVQAFDLVSEYHLMKAVEIGMPRKWYTPFAEYSTALSLDPIKEIDSDMYEKVSDLSRIVYLNYKKLGILSEIVETTERNSRLNVQIGYKILQGKSNDEISEALGISKYRVKKQIEEFYEFAGITSKRQISEFVRKNLHL